jgi:cyclin-dependent kinase 3
MEEVNKRFDKIKVLGEGTYGKVYKVLSHKDNNIYALKKIKIEDSEGFPPTALREVSNLLSLDHPNIVKIHDIYYESEAKILEIFYEYIDQDLR